MKLHLYVDQAEIVRNALYSHMTRLKVDSSNKHESELQECERLILFLNQEIEKERV